MQKTNSNMPWAQDTVSEVETSQIGWRSLLITAILLLSGSWLFQKRHRQNQVSCDSLGTGLM